MYVKYESSITYHLKVITNILCRQRDIQTDRQTSRQDKNYLSQSIDEDHKKSFSQWHCLQAY